MKCCYICDIDVCEASLPQADRARLAAMPAEAPGNVKFRANPNNPKKPIRYWPKGTIREVDNAVWLCQRGVAVPADEECAKALGFTDDQFAAAKHVYQRIVDGIHPDDFALYDAGVMTGYNMDGSMKPGPKWDEYQAAKATATEESNKDGI